MSDFVDHAKSFASCFDFDLIAMYCPIFYVIIPVLVKFCSRKAGRTKSVSSQRSRVMTFPHQNVTNWPNLKKNSILYSMIHALKGNSLWCFKCKFVYKIQTLDQKDFGAIR